MESWGSLPTRSLSTFMGPRGRRPRRRLWWTDLYGKFHVYALEWYANHMDFFLDGRKILTYTENPATGWAFDHAMYLIMNVACSGPDEPAPDNFSLAQFMTVDYVRVYQQTTSGRR
jgi:beta-glucanase (GH16 family)